jgi:hypothetical protein
MLQRALAVFTLQLDFLDLGGRPRLRFFRLACNRLKYSEPRFAIFFPPFRPRATAAGSFYLAKGGRTTCLDIMHYVYRRYKQSQCNALSCEPVHRHHSRVAPCSILPNLRNRRPFSNPTHRVMTRLSKSADSVDKDQLIR